MEDSIVAIVQSITDECSTRGIDATPALIAYTVRSIISAHLDDFQIDVSSPLDDEKTVMLHDQAIELLTDQTSLPMLTIRMQVDMDLGLVQAERSQKQKEERELEHRSAIEQELITTRARSQTALESLYRKIVSYSIIASKWGSPNDPQCVRQATAALEQVFPFSDLSKFIAGTDDDKRKKLQDLSKLVLGVRVFQTFGGDLADPSTNLRLEIPKKLEALKSRISTAIEGINSVIFQYEEVLKTDPGMMSEEEKIKRRRLTDELANRQQFLFFYELLLARLKETSQTVDQNCAEFDSLVDNLRGLMEKTDSLPQAKAAPIFSALAVVWTSFKKSEDSIKSFELLLARLRKHRDTFQYSINDQTEGTAAGTARIEDEGEVKIENQQAESIPMECDVIADDAQPVLVQRDADSEFAFNGFCPVTLVRRDGLLLPGDVVLGSVKWERRYYAFVDTEARALFQENPAKWHNDALAVARRRPELISLLGLQSEFPTLKAPKIPVKPRKIEPPNSKYRNVGVETLVHPVESYIDRTYHWNQWELMKRKKILKGLENKRTKGAQTKESHYRRESHVQCQRQMKDQSEQTRVDSGVAMPRTVRYIAGLRGDTLTQAKVVTMTFDYDGKKK